MQRLWSYRGTSRRRRGHPLAWLAVPIVAVLVWTVRHARAADDGAALTDEPLAPIVAPLGLDPARVRLGERLFADVRLSHRNQTACVSCHRLDNGGADGVRFNPSAEAGRMLDRNTPAIFNVALNFRFNWIGQFRDLAAQNEFVLLSPWLMNSTWPELLGKLREDREYRTAFDKAYGGPIDAASVLDALESYERSLVTPNARFDRYLRGDRTAIAPAEEEGYRLFKAFGCAACHQGVNIGGNLFQKFGVFEAPYASDAPSGSADLGRFAITGRERDRYVFRVPSLRNVALTAPYFHDGSAATLEAAVSVMALKQLGRTLEGAEVDRLVAFLRTLTGDLPGQPGRAGRIRAMIGRLLPHLIAGAGLAMAVSLSMVRFGGPDRAMHERILGAIRTLTLEDTALQRDVLEARAGILPNYDPLVRDVIGSRGALAELRRAGDVAIAARLQSLEAAIDEQETLLEAFKSDNALLRNSVRYLTFMLATPIARQTGAEQQEVEREVGRLADAMLLFMHDPRTDSTRQVKAFLDRLGAMPIADAEMARGLQSLVLHGHLIVSTLPAVDATLARLIRVPTARLARALEETYLENRARAEATARLSWLGLYGSTAVLALCLVRLFYAMWANARALARRTRLLQSRLDFQGLMTEASTRVASAQRREDLDAAIVRLIGRIGEMRGFDHAYVVLVDEDSLPGEVSHWWARPGLESRPDRRRALLAALREPWVASQIAAHEYVAIPSAVALPPGPGQTLMRRLGAAAWLCLPLRAENRHVGYLGFEAPRDGSEWSDTDIALIGTIGEVVANAIDREQSETRRKELEARLRQSEKMEAIGTLAGGIAHDYNNILGAILGYGEMALQAMDPASPAGRYVREMVAAGERAASLVGNLLLFSRRGDAPRGLVAVQPVVAEAIELARGTLPAGIAIRTRLAADGAAVSGEATQIHRVAMNLYTNAIQAMDGNGVLDVTLDVVDVPGPRAVASGALAEGRYVRLEVTDTGCGMDDATRARVFDPFFTTKAVGQGTGLGLATVHGIVTEQGGQIDVRGEPGAGSTFTVYFAFDGMLAEEPAREPPAPGRGRGEVILLVDDEVALVRLGEEMLAGLGFEPVGFESARRALDSFRSDPARFDLMLSDWAMPDLDGLTLASEIHAIRPDLPILLMTGQAAAMTEAALRTAGVGAVLRKPLSSVDLAAAIVPLVSTSANPCVHDPHDAGAPESQNI